MEPSHPAVEENGDASGFVLEQIDSLGEGLVADGRGAIAVSASGRVAVADNVECQVTVLDLATHATIYRTGSCGEGPKEFRGIAGVAFVGDSVMAFDAPRRSMVVLSPSGEVVRRFVPVAMLQDSLTALEAMVSVSDRVLGVADSRPTVMSHAVVYLRAPDGALVGGVGRTPAAQHTRSDVLRAPVRSCVVRRDGGTMFVATNPYRPETIAYDRAGTILWRSTASLQPVAPTPHEGRVWPSAVVRTPVCSEAFVMSRTIDLEMWAPRSATIDQGVVEIRGLDGRVVFATRIDAAHTELFGSAAGWKDRWVFNDPFGESPQLRVFRLRPRAAGDRADIIVRASSGELPRGGQ